MRPDYSPPPPPSPDEIRKVLSDSQLSIAQAAKLIEVNISTFEAWLYGRNPMPRPVYTLLLILSGNL